MILAKGAEAFIEKEGDSVRKVRSPKAYRHPELDMQLRKARTRREAKVLEKIPVFAPKLLRMDDTNMVVEMQYIDGLQLRDVLTEKNAKAYGKELGVMIRRMHDAGIIHGDLTTSNILVQEQLVLIDFGLSFFSEHEENKAVDLHVLKQAVAAKHPNVDVFTHIWNAYNPDDALKKRFSLVEGRGRYKGKK